MGMSSAQIITGLVVVAVAAVALGYIELPTFEAGVPGVGPTPACGFGSATHTAETINDYTNAVTDVYLEVWDSNNVLRYNNSGSGRVSISSSAPTALTGFLFTGNDNHMTGGRGDLGTEYYFQKVPFSYGPCEGRVDMDVIRISPEGTPTWTGYDDSAAEATTNITIGSGATVTLLSLKAEASADGCVGNPAIPNSVAVCFNASNTAHWDEVRPASYVQKIDAPSFLSSMSIVNDECFVLGNAICDYESYKFDMILDAGVSQNPGTADYIYAKMLDKTFYIGDDMKIHEGWGYESDLAADTDIGMTSEGNEKIVYLN